MPAIPHGWDRAATTPTVFWDTSRELCPSDAGNEGRTYRFEQDRLVLSALKYGDLDFERELYNIRYWDVGLAGACEGIEFWILVGGFRDR